MNGRALAWMIGLVVAVAFGLPGILIYAAIGIGLHIHYRLKYGYWIDDPRAPHYDCDYWHS